MTQLKKINAKNIGIIVAYIQDKIEYGYCFLISKESPVVGCQCQKCNTIIWVNDYKNKITSEKRPEKIPSSGIEYQRYYEDKINRLLNSIPNCPSCGSRGYKYVNNVSIPMFQNGYVLSPEDQPLLKVDKNAIIEVWILDDD